MTPPVQSPTPSPFPGEQSDAVERLADFVLVPREPTEEMCRAGAREYFGSVRYSRDYEYVDAQLAPKFKAAWDAMLDAAPAPRAGEPSAMGAAEALAEAMASLDGKLDEFCAGRIATSLLEEPGGHYSGYFAEAEEVIRRMSRRGVVLALAGSGGDAVREALKKLSADREDARKRADTGGEFEEGEWWSAYGDGLQTAIREVTLALARPATTRSPADAPSRAGAGGEAGAWPASYQETFDAISKAVTWHPGHGLGISVKEFYRALSYPDASPAPPSRSDGLVAELDRLAEDEERRAVTYHEARDLSVAQACDARGEAFREAARLAAAHGAPGAGTLDAEAVARVRLSKSRHGGTYESSPFEFYPVEPVEALLALLADPAQGTRPGEC